MHDDQRGWLRRRPIAVALLCGACLALVAGCSGPAVKTGSSSSASSTAGPVTVSLPVVGCPTTVAVARAAPAASLPPSRPVAVPQALAARLSVYSDDQGVMELVGPRGWSCAAFYAADGRGGVAVYPRGERLPRSWTAGWPLARTSAAAAITGVESSACYTCTLAQACRLFPAAAQTLRGYLGRQTCPVRPAAETVTPIGAGIMGFEDPPGVDGDGLPSGGQYPANGVMTYHPGAHSGSWLESCTLPGSDKAECTAVLNTFVSWYGQQ